MNSKLIKMVTTVTWLSNIAIVVGAFLNFLLFYEMYDYNDEWKPFMLFDCFEHEFFAGYKTFIIAMGIGIVVSIVAINTFKTSGGCISSVVMLIDAIAGMCCFYSIRNGIKDAYHDAGFWTRDGVGATVMKISYILLIIVAVVALGIDIYNMYYYAKKNTRRNGVFSADANICPRCRKKVSIGEKFCDVCGFSLASLTCPNCGAKRDTTSVYCKECGERLPVLNMRKSDE